MTSDHKQDIARKLDIETPREVQTEASMKSSMESCISSVLNSDQCPAKDQLSASAASLALLESATTILGDTSQDESSLPVQDSAEQPSIAAAIVEIVEFINSSADEPGAYDVTVEKAKEFQEMAATEMFTNTESNLPAELIQSNLDDTILTQRSEPHDSLVAQEQCDPDNYPKNVTDICESPTQTLETSTHENGNISGNENCEKRTEAQANDEDYSCVTYVCDTSSNDEFILNQISSLYNRSEYSFVSIRHGIHPDQRKTGSSRILTA